MGEANENNSAARDVAKRSPGGVDLAYELSGRLPCTTCAYDLAGLSVLDRCPECGTLIRDTLLVLVDPFGESVPKVRRPRILACAVLGCTGSAMLACVAMIVHRSGAMACASADLLCGLSWLAPVGVAMMFVGAVCGLGLVRPTRSTRLVTMLGAVLGSVCLAAAGATAAVTLLVNDQRRVAPYLDVPLQESARVLEHGLTHVLLLTAVVLFRPNARAISSIAWRVRENHDNRQRLLTVAACIGVVLIGDGVMLASRPLDREAGAIVALCGELLVFTGSGILAAALLGVLLDSVSIARTLWRMPIAFRDVVRRAPA